MTLFSRFSLSAMLNDIKIKQYGEVKMTVHYSVVKYSTVTKSLLNKTLQEHPSFCFIVPPVKI